MAGKDNLRVPSSAEARKNGKKGGIASGKARRKKADLKKAFEIILNSDVVGEKNKQLLESMGYIASNEMLLAFSTFQKATQGNQRAVENIIKLTNTKDKYDIEEQKARTQLIKKRIELVNKDSLDNTATVIFNNEEDI